jgi:hypothetical protein
MRTDGKPLMVAHARMIVHYCAWIIKSIVPVEAPKGCYTSKQEIDYRFRLMNMQADRLMKHASEKGLRQFWEDAHVGREDGPVLKDTAVSPFEV